MHLMVDTETLGRKTINVPVIEMAVVMFDHNNIYDDFTRDIKPNFDLSTPEVDTLIWWNEQAIKMPLNKNALELPATGGSRI